MLLCYIAIVKLYPLPIAALTLILFHTLLPLLLSTLCFISAYLHKHFTYSHKNVCGNERCCLSERVTWEYFLEALGECFGWPLAHVSEQSEFMGVHPNK